jgi:hypothetical protein
VRRIPEKQNPLMMFLRSILMMMMITGKNNTDEDAVDSVEGEQE